MDGKLDVVSESLQKLLEEYPYYRPLFSGIQRLADPAIGTLAVSWNESKFVLRYNPHFMRALPPVDRVAALHHEGCHIFSEHPLRAKNFFGDNEVDRESAQKWHAVCDAAIWRYIDEYHSGDSLLARHAINPNRVGWPSRISAEKAYIDRDLSGLSHSTTITDEIYDRDNENGSIRNPEEMTDEQIRQWLAREDPMPLREDSDSPGHLLNMPDWELNTGEEMRMDRRMDRMAEANFETQVSGQTPGNHRERIEDLRREEQARQWKRKVRTAFGKKQSPDRTVNKKFRDRRWGIRPRVENDYQARVMIAVDTSGSMQKWYIVRSFQESKMLVNKVQADLVLCSREIKEVYENYDGDVPDIVGRGGTSFDPVFQMYEDDGGYDRLVYFTDGKADEGSPRDIDMLWVYPEKNHSPAAWGERAIIPRQEEDSRSVRTTTIA